MTVTNFSVDPGEPPVKTSRRYDSSVRAERARATRGAVVASARVLLLRDGYAATTVAAIASRAGVSNETVYKSFGGKPGVVRAVWEDALAGAGGEHAELRSDRLSEADDDPRRVLRGWMDLMVEVAPRVVPVLLLVRSAAAVDADMARLWREVETSRLGRMSTNATALATHGHLRSGVTVEHAAQVMWTYTAPELFERLVLDCGWSPEQLAEFVGEALASALLDP